MKYRLKSNTCTRRHTNKNTEKMTINLLNLAKNCPLRTLDMAFQVIKISNVWGKNPPHPLAAHPIGAPVTRRCLKNIPVLHTQKVGQFVEVLPIKAIHKPTWGLVISILWQ